MWWTDAAARGRILTAALLLAGAAACAPISTSEPNRTITPTEQYSVQVKEAPDQVAFSAHPDGLSLTQRAALTALVSRWRGSPGAGDVTVQAPAGDRGPAASRTASETLAALQGLGVPANRISAGGYDGPAGAPILVRYEHLEAKGPDCEGGWDDLTATGANKPSTHFGCAITANFAAQVADPRDLLNPSPEEPSDAARRDTVLGKYRTGQITSTPRDDQATGAVSKVGN